MSEVVKLVSNIQLYICSSTTLISVIYSLLSDTFVILCIMFFLFCSSSKYVAGYLIEERRRWPIITASPRGQCSKYIQNLEGKACSDERKPFQLPGRMKNSSYYYCPGRGSNSRPSAHRGFKHGQGVPRP